MLGVWRWVKCGISVHQIGRATSWIHVTAALGSDKALTHTCLLNLHVCHARSWAGLGLPVLLRFLLLFHIQSLTSNLHSQLEYTSSLYCSPTSSCPWIGEGEAEEAARKFPRCQALPPSCQHRLLLGKVEREGYAPPKAWGNGTVQGRLHIRITRQL